MAVEKEPTGSKTVDTKTNNFSFLIFFLVSTDTFYLGLNMIPSPYKEI
jgi:hypothetical protein